MSFFLKLSESLTKALEAPGKILGLLPLTLVIIEFLIVILLFVFAGETLQLEESLRYFNSLMFLGAVGYTALKDEHVRVDILYHGFSQRNQSVVNLIGHLMFTLPFAIFFFASALPFVQNSVSIFEGSPESGGLPFVYILKSLLILFPFTLSLAAVREIITSIIALREGDPDEKAS